MANGCIEVCDEVIGRLSALGFDLGDDDDHDPIFEALDKVTFVKDETLQGLKGALETIYTRLGEALESDELELTSIQGETVSKWQNDLWPILKSIRV